MRLRPRLLEPSYAKVLRDWRSKVAEFRYYVLNDSKMRETGLYTMVHRDRERSWPTQLALALLWEIAWRRATPGEFYDVVNRKGTHSRSIRSNTLLRELCNVCPSVSRARWKQHLKGMASRDLLTIGRLRIGIVLVRVAPNSWYCFVRDSAIPTPRTAPDEAPRSPADIWDAQLRSAGLDPDVFTNPFRGS